MRDGVNGEKRDCGRGCESFLESELSIQADNNLELPISASVWKPVYQVSTSVAHDSSQVRGIFLPSVNLLLSVHTHVVVVFLHNQIISYRVPQEASLCRHIRQFIYIQYRRSPCIDRNVSKTTCEILKSISRQSYFSGKNTKCSYLVGQSLNNSRIIMTELHVF